MRAHRVKAHVKPSLRRLPARRHLPVAERKMLADLVVDLGFAKIDVQSREKEVKRQLRQLRGES
jgi:hypothetical protein